MSWLTGRTNGYSSGELISNPAYILESLLRDEVFTERKLTLTSKLLNDTFGIDGLRYGVEDYYVNAILFNVTRNESEIIKANTANRIVNINAAHSSWQANDNVYITNIKGNAKIDVASFDTVGNTTNGLRDGWVFAKCINSRTSVQDLVNSLLYESRCLLLRENNKYKLVAIEKDATTTETLTNPLKQGGQPLVSWKLSPFSDVYTEFNLNYAIDTARNTQTKRQYCSSKGNSLSDSTSQTYCANAETNYKVFHKWNYTASWIYDDNTAIAFLKEIVKYSTYQRMIVTWIGDYKNHIKYQIGDQVKINYSSIIPNSKNNSAIFMVTGFRIDTNIGGVVLTLEELV